MIHSPVELANRDRLLFSRCRKGSVYRKLKLMKQHSCFVGKYEAGDL